MAFLEQSSSRIMQKTSSDHSIPSSPEHTDSTSITAPRSLKQLRLFLAGCTFFTLSTLITRRALARKYTSIFPRFYHPSNQPPSMTVNARLDAYEALSIATINVISFAVMLTGGTLWAFDISSMDELRQKVSRKRLELDETGSTERDNAAEEEWKELLGRALGKKDDSTRKEKDDEEEWRRDERGKSS
ncbi:MAG: hypothetical protein HETSPECPRED_008936 [Heterodermia speciosa]|uniref:Altered inheritance of mitochondria protein 11 n=1 Tax=Heterodermia speciosa TaxID=116794 RepID=A0A8H3IAP2_9LECA|nr:MAG: hypothetical protein HETSPECPRED_008936 [Heterodermia speciosa]